MLYVEVFDFLNLLRLLLFLEDLKDIANIMLNYKMLNNELNII